MKNQTAVSLRALTMSALPFLLVALSGAARAITVVKAYTGADQSFVVPAGVTTLTVKLWGAVGHHDMLHSGRDESRPYRNSHPPAAQKQPRPSRCIRCGEE